MNTIINEKKLNNHKWSEIFFNYDQAKILTFGALVLGVWSCFSKFNLIYPITSAVCAILAGYSYITVYRRKH